jgi:hypothetical protein
MSCVLLFSKFLQELCNIPFAAAASGKRPRPSGNGIDIKALLEQALNIVPPRAAAMAHDNIGRIGMLRVHGYYRLVVGRNRLFG